MKTILVYPDRAFYHKLDAILNVLGIKQTNDINDEYDYVIYFDFKNSYGNVVDFKSDIPVINNTICSTDKKSIDKAFEIVFKYSSIVKSGRCVKKSIHHANKELSGILDKPDNEEGFIYQRVLGGTPTKEYRCTIIGGEIVICWERTVPRLLHFPKGIVGYYDGCEVVSPFTSLESQDILTFCGLFGIDFADIDIMRDDDGKLYIIDVNETASYNILYGRPKDELLLIAEKFKEMLKCMYKN